MFNEASYLQLLNAYFTALGQTNSHKLVLIKQGISPISGVLRWE